LKSCNIGHSSTTTYRSFTRQCARELGLDWGKGPHNVAEGFARVNIVLCNKMREMGIFLSRLHGHWSQFCLSTLLSRTIDNSLQAGQPFLFNHALQSLCISVSLSFQTLVAMLRNWRRNRTICLYLLLFQKHSLQIFYFLKLLLMLNKTISIEKQSKIISILFCEKFCSYCKFIYGTLSWHANPKIGWKVFVTEMTIWVE
jgi:hypothetical protein